MKLLLTKCGICHDWYSPKRSHCPSCCAARVYNPLTRSLHHIDPACASRPGIQLVTGIPSVMPYVNEHLTAIAGILMENER